MVTEVISDVIAQEKDLLVKFGDPRSNVEKVTGLISQLREQV